MIFKRVDIKNKAELNDFLDLPKKLYSKKELTQDRDRELQLLCGEHILSKYFNIEAYLLYVNNEAVCRCILTTTNTTDICYFGLFESVNNADYCKYFFDNLDTISRDRGISELVGPIDASFWIKYRMKISNFDTIYTGEPSNKDYYYNLLTECGYKVKQSYVTNFMDNSSEDNLEEKITSLERKLLLKRGNEYRIENLRNKDKDKVLIDLYSLFSSLYSSFPFYSHIEEHEFTELFKPMFKIINEDFVLLAYDKNNDLVGFSISLPDYQNLLNEKRTPLNLLKILRIKRKPKRLVNLYVGVCQKDLGLGKLLTCKLTKLTRDKGIKYGIAALILEGKITGSYFKNCITNQTKYVILHKEI